jgi:hypothetical protein
LSFCPYVKSCFPSLSSISSSVSASVRLSVPLAPLLVSASRLSVPLLTCQSFSPSVSSSCPLPVSPARLSVYPARLLVFASRLWTPIHLLVPFSPASFFSYRVVLWRDAVDKKAVWNPGFSLANFLILLQYSVSNHHSFTLSKVVFTLCPVRSYLSKFIHEMFES